MIPLTEKDTVHFCTLDIDQYKNDAEWLWNLVLVLKEEPLAVSSSKSGGAHIWLFSKEGIPAKLAID